MTIIGEKIHGLVSEKENAGLKPTAIILSIGHYAALGVALGIGIGKVTKYMSLPVYCDYEAPSRMEVIADYDYGDVPEEKIDTSPFTNICEAGTRRSCHDIKVSPGVNNFYALLHCTRCGESHAVSTRRES